MALVSNSKYGTAVELAAGSAPSTDVGLYAKDGGGDNAHLVLQAHTASFTGDVHVTGTLYVEGTINSTNRNETNLIVEDKTITVASGSDAAATADSGIHFGGSDDSPIATFRYKNTAADGGVGSHLLSSTDIKASGEIHGTSISGSGVLDMGGAGNFAGNLRTEGTLNVDGTSTMQTVNAQALTATTISGSSNLEIAGTADIVGNLRTEGTLTSEGALDVNSTANIQGALTLQDGLSVGGNTTLGDANTDSVGVTGSFSIYNTNVGQDFLSYQADTDHAIVNGGQIFLQPYTKLQLGLAGAQIVAVAQMTASNGFLASAGLNATTMSASSNLQVGGTADFDGNVTMDNDLTVSGELSLTAVSASSNLQVGGNADVAGNIRTEGTLTSEGALDVNSTANIEGALTLQAGLTMAGALDANSSANIQGAVVLQSTLNAQGAVDFDSTLNVDGTSTMQAVNAQALTATTISGSGAFECASTGDFVGNVRTEGTLTSEGALDVNSSANIEGAVVLQSTLNAQGAVDCDSTLNVDGTSTMQAVNAQALTATTISGSSNLQIGGTADFDGAVTMDNTLAVAGNFSVGSYGLTTAGAATIASMAGNWTNAGRTVADMGTVTTMDLDGGTIDGATIATSDITVGSGKTLNVSAGTLTTSAAQKKAIIEGAGSDLDVGAYDLRAQTLTADSMTSGRVAIYGTNGVLSEDSDLTFSGDTLTATKIGAFEAAGAINFSDEEMTNVNIDSGAIDGAVIGANSAAAGTFTSVVASSTMTATEFIATSDARLKSNIQGVTNAMDVINHLQGVEYDLNETGDHSMGVLAQDLIEVAPALVKTRENGNYAVNYSGLSAFFVEAIKEQQAQIEDLKNTVKELSK